MSAAPPSELLLGLRKVMGDQRVLFRESLAAARKQREALLVHDADALARLTSEEQRLGAALKSLEAERKEVWRRVAASIGRPEAELVWEHLEAAISPGEAREFSSLLDEMNDLLRDLVSENAGNLHLLQKGLESSDFTVRAAASAASGTYGPDGQKDSSLGGLSVDRTA